MTHHHREHHHIITTMINNVIITVMTIESLLIIFASCVDISKKNPTFLFQITVYLNKVAIGVFPFTMR